MSQNELTLKNPVLESATRQAFEGKLKDQEIDKFIEATTGPQSLSITATGGIFVALFWGKVVCEPKDQKMYPYLFDESVWGLGGSVKPGSLGVLVTFYDSWDPFWKNTDGFFAQGIAKGVGYLQINFFKGSSLIGQYHGATGGVGGLAVGGSGSWKKQE